MGRSREGGKDGWMDGYILCRFDKGKLIFLTSERKEERGDGMGMWGGVKIVEGGSFEGKWKAFMAGYCERSSSALLCGPGVEGEGEGEGEVGMLVPATHVCKVPMHSMQPCTYNS